MKDVYISGFTDRISPEAPVPIVRVTKTEFKAGGAANVAVNLATLGLQVTLLSMVGDDKSAREIQQLLSSHNINCIFIKSPNLTTVQKHRIISQHQQILRLDYESQNPKLNFQKKDYSELLKKFEKEAKSETYSAAIFSDYKKGVLEHCKRLVKSAKKHKIPVFVDPKGDEFAIYEGANFLKPNIKEFENIVGMSTTKDEFNSKAKKLKKLLKIDNLLITKGSSGMTLFTEENMPIDIPAQNSREVFDVTGAGDTVLASVVAAYLSKFSILDSVKIANSSAGIVVGKFGTASVDLLELKDLFENSPKNQSRYQSSNDKEEIINKIIAKKIISSDLEIKALVGYLKKNNKKLVFTNGCFDILHAGHVHLFRECRKFGDLLLVGINSDKSVRTLKGESRPVNYVKNRIEVLKSLKFIDFIITFKEKTPENLIKKLKPYCLVKGGDYQDKDIVGSDFVKENGGKVEIVSYKRGLSTTLTMKKI